MLPTVTRFIIKQTKEILMVMKTEPGKKKYFIVYAVILEIISILCMFMFAGLHSEHMNVIQTFITEKGGGWSANMTMLPMTIGNLICIALTFVFGTLFIRIGVRKTMIPFMVLSGLGCVGISLANGLDCFGGVASGNYPLFFASMMLVRCASPVFQMGAMMLITNWFIRLRGRMASICSMGATIFTVVGTSAMPNVIAKSWNGDYRPFYYGVGVLCILMAVVMGVFLKDFPEDAGLFPDGTDHAPISEKEDETPLTVSEVLRDPIAWKVAIVQTAPTVLLSGMMSSMALSFITRGGSDLWLQATVFVSVGAIAGVACSLLFGVLNDKLGALITMVLFLISMLIPTLTLMFMPSHKNTVLLIILAVGLALSLGAAPVTHPCLVAHFYGRKKFQSVNRVTMALEMIPGSFSGIMMTSLIRSGHAKLAYLILIILVVISFITLMTMMKIPDANAADRDSIHRKA